MWNKSKLLENCVPYIWTDIIIIIIFEFRLQETILQQN